MTTTPLQPAAQAVAMQGLAAWLRSQAAQFESAPWHNDAAVREHIETLRTWAREVDAASPPTSLLVMAAKALVEEYDAGLPRDNPAELVEALRTALDELEQP